jgi:hypothetical protein
VKQCNSNYFVQKVLQEMQQHIEDGNEIFVSFCELQFTPQITVLAILEDLLGQNSLLMYNFSLLQLN